MLSAWSGCSAISSASASSQVRPRSCSMFQALVQTFSKNQRRSSASGISRLNGMIGVVVDQHLADVEDDVADFGHSGLPLVRMLSAFGDAGYGSLDCLLHDGRQGLAVDRCRRRPPMPGRGGPLADIGAEDGEVEREMGEDVGDPARPAASRPRRARRRRRSSPSRPRRPVGGRHLGHAAEQAACPGACATAPRRRRAPRRRPRRRAAAAPAWAPCTGNAFGIAEAQRRAVVVERADHAGRPARRADRGAEIHHRLGEIARPARAAPSCSTAAWISGLAAGSGVSIASSRAITRSTLPSTTAAGRSKAIAAIAAAV